MRRWSFGIGVGILSLLVGVSGCGDLFGPPSRPKKSVTTQAETPKTKAIYLITPTVPTQEHMSWGREARDEANANQAILKVFGPTPDSAPDPNLQLNTIRNAIADQASALLVIPGDSAELAKTLAETEASGIPVVLLGRSIPAPAGSKPFTVIEFDSFDPSATKIVAATLEDAKKAGRPTPGTALVLADKTMDLTSAARVDALKKAATSAGCKVVELSLDGLKPEESAKQVTEAVAANPDVSVILTDDPETMNVATRVRLDLFAKTPLSVGGYLEYSFSKAPISITTISCFSQGRYEQLGTLGVRTLLSKLKGETVPERVTLKPLFKRVDRAAEGSPIKIPVPLDAPPPAPRKDSETKPKP